MQTLLVALAVLACVLAPCAASTDACSQYPDCFSCLSVNLTDVNSRPYCGWCHTNIVYKDGHQGARCADIRDDPWICPGVYDTYQCTAGYKCNFATGQCEITSPGEGFANITDCQTHCFKTPDVYRCNTTTYQCLKCDNPQDPDCQDQATACATCNPPTDVKFKCVKNPPATSKYANLRANDTQCVRCGPTDKGCSDFHTACANCYTPPPPPPSPPSPPSPQPTPPPPAPTQNFTCNTKTLQCEVNPKGTPFASCSSVCSNSTPADQVGIWRGIQAQMGFPFGEYDFNFTADGVVMKDPTGALTTGKVTVLNNMRIEWLDGEWKGKITQVLKFYLANGPETSSIALAFGKPNGGVPESLADAMLGKDGQIVFVLTQCNSWKSWVCDFSSVFETSLAALRREARAAHLVIAERGQDADPCNVFDDCSTCVGQRFGQLQCGWCMGATIIYNATGDSGKKCAGFVDGQPLAFTCPANFRTQDCSGFSCNWNLTEPQCIPSDDGEYSDKDTCQQTCKATAYSKCNLATKQCEPCTQGSPGCTTEEVCQASCSLDHSICDYATKQCAPCDPLNNPNCTMTTAECNDACSQNTYGLCNPDTGTCDPCDPTTTQGCVSSCSKSCQKGGGYQCIEETQQCVPGGNMTLDACGLSCLKYSCNKTSYQCEIGKGNQTLEDCAADCAPPLGNYGCDWNNSSQPVCRQGLGDESLSDCQLNCKAPAFAKCNYETGTCQTCDPASGDPACKYTQAYCSNACRPSGTLGVWRGIEISKGFKWGEWDFTFYYDGKVAFELHGENPIKYEALVANSGQAQEGSSITFSLLTAPEDGPLGLAPGDILTGLFTSSDGQDQITKFLNLGLSQPGGTAQTFDEAMTQFAFVLVSCKDSTHCNFGPAELPE